MGPAEGTGGFTLWLPPPTVACQLLSYFLGLWVASPWTTLFAAVIPQVMQNEWAYLSCYMVRVGVKKWEAIPCNKHPHTLPIPVVVMYAAPHTCVLSKHRGRPPPLPTTAEWHRKQANTMRGLQG